MVGIPSLDQQVRRLAGDVKRGSVTLSEAADIAIQINEDLFSGSQEDIEVDSTNGYSNPREQNIFHKNTVVTDKTGGAVAYGQPTYAFGLQGMWKLFSEFEKTASDVSYIYEKMADDFFKTNKKLIFSQMGSEGIPGFHDLNESTKRIKQGRIDGVDEAMDITPTSETGVKTISVYPILVKSGRLMRSLTGGKGGLKLIKKKEFAIGTSETHAVPHQYGCTGVSNIGLAQFVLRKRTPVRFNVGRRVENWSGALSDALISIRGRKLA